MRNYKTQMEAAKKGIVTPEMETVAKKENMDVNELMALVAAGQVAIPANVNHTALSAEGIGKGLKTKINVNLGISGDAKNYDIEMQKADMAIKFGAEAIMDLSNYGITMIPLGARTRSSASAICTVRRSWICGLLAYTSTVRASLL